LNETARARCAPRPTDCSGNGGEPKNHKARKPKQPAARPPDNFVFSYGTEKTAKKGCNQRAASALVSA